MDEKLKTILWHPNIGFNRNISYSQINMFIECPKKYYYSYACPPEQKIRSKTWLKTCLGSALHAAMEKFYEEIKSGGRPQDVEFMLPEYSNRLYQEITKDRNNIIYEFNPPSFQSQSDLDAYAAQKEQNIYELGVKLLGMFIRDYYAEEDQYEVVDIEAKFECILPDGPNYPGIGNTKFVGYIDKIDRHKLTKQYRVVDHKSATDFDKDKIYTDWQLTLYAYIANKIFNIPAKAVAYHVLTTDVKNLGINWQYEFRDQKHFDQMLNEFNQLLPMMKRVSQFHPRRPGKHCMFCAMQNSCIYGR